MTRFRQFLTGFKQDPTPGIGLWQAEDGSVWLRNPDGSDTEVSGGGSQPLIMPPTSASPFGVVTPTGIGYLIQDTTNGALYQAVGVTSNDWVSIGGMTSHNAGVQLGTGSQNYNWQVTDSNGNTALDVDDAADIGKTRSSITTGFNTLDNGEGDMITNGNAKLAGAAKTLGFYGATGVAKQTGVAVDAAAIHAALVALGLITA